MGLIQPILIASAALAVLASTSKDKSRASHAADLDINDVSNVGAYFSDVVPTDWAYQALSNLVEQYGCVAGYNNEWGYSSRMADLACHIAENLGL